MKETRDELEAPVERKSLMKNPVVFQPEGFLAGFYKRLILFEVFGKCVIFLSCFPPWGSIFINDDQKKLSFYGFMMLLSVVDVYYVLFLGYRKDEVPMKRRFRNLLLHPVAYLALANLLIKIVLARKFWYMPHHSQLFDRYTDALSIGSFHWTRPFFTLFLTLVDIFFVSCGICYCLDKYEPLKNVRYYRKVRELRQNGGDLSVLDSRSFKIILANVGDTELTDLHLKITRKITTTSAGCCCFCKMNVQCINFAIRIPILKSGESITIIPESHVHDGAIRVERFRAFGYDVGEKVETIVRHKKTKAKLVEEYEKTNGEIYMGDEICPRWSRTAQNPNYMRTLM